jgi:hypothetical protein
MCTWICISTCCQFFFHNFGYTCRSGIARSYNLVFKFEELPNFSTMALPFCFSINSGWGYQFLHIFSDTYYFSFFIIMAILVGMEVVSVGFLFLFFSPSTGVWTQGFTLDLLLEPLGPSPNCGFDLIFPYDYLWYISWPFVLTLEKYYSSPSLIFNLGCLFCYWVANITFWYIFPCCFPEFVPACVSFSSHPHFYVYCLSFLFFSVW